MKKTTIAQGIVVGTAMTLIAALPVQAMVVGQTQEMSNSSSAKVEMTGGTATTGTAATTTSEASSTAWGKQTQRVEVNSDVFTFAPVQGRRFKRVRPVAMVYVDRTDGQVRLNWDMRGGTCHVRYTEASARSYRYATAAGCDDGGVTIGGLTPGVTYRFQVRQDDGVWSLPVTVKAW